MRDSNPTSSPDSGSGIKLPPIIQEQVECLRVYRKRHLEFPEQLEKARQAVVEAEADLAQAKKSHLEAQGIAQSDALMNPGLTNDTLRKAAVAKANAEDPIVLTAAKVVHEKTQRLAARESAFDHVKDQWKAVHAAQSAAIKVIDAYMIFKPNPSEGAPC